MENTNRPPEIRQRIKKKKYLKSEDKKYGGPEVSCSLIVKVLLFNKWFNQRPLTEIYKYIFAAPAERPKDCTNIFRTFSTRCYLLFCNICFVLPPLEQSLWDSGEQNDAPTQYLFIQLYISKMFLGIFCQHTISHFTQNCLQMLPSLNFKYVLLLLEGTKSY